MSRKMEVFDMLVKFPAELHEVGSCLDSLDARLDTLTWLLLEKPAASTGGLVLEAIREVVPETHVSCLSCNHRWILPATSSSTSAAGLLLCEKCSSTKTTCFHMGIADNEGDCGKSGGSLIDSDWK